MDSTKKLLDLSDSTLLLQGTEKEQSKYRRLINSRDEDLEDDANERRAINSKRRDFYTGNQGEYSNVTGILKDTKQKRGHTNQVTNYAGKTVVKMAFGLANNPPHQTVNPLNINDDIEVIKAQAVEDYQDSIFDENNFWKKTYRRAVFIQGEYGDTAIKTYIEGDQIKICGHDNMDTVKVGWNGKPGEYDFTIVENYLSPTLVEELYGIKVNKAVLKTVASDKNKSTGSWQNNGQWGTKTGTGSTALPSGKNKLPMVKVLEYDSLDAYAIMIESELVSLVIKDDINYPKEMLWTIVPNVPNPPSPWSIADIDYLIDPQIEINENDNRSADHLRVGNVQRYVAYNMDDFDPESIKTSSGQVIFVSDPEGKSKFEPLATNINNFPDDQYATRKTNQLHDMGLPKVNYGAGGADSGRSKAIDYQSSVDLTQFKRDAWELAMQQVCRKIQVFGNFLLGEDVDWFTNTDGEFITRRVEFDWNDVLPISASDKIVNVANKVNMIGLSIKTALKELGYRNVDAELEQIKKELDDPKLMILRSKMWQFSEGILQAQNAAAMATQSNADQTQVTPDTPNPNQAAPTLTSSQNSGASPMAAKGGTAVSSAQGVLDKAQQNMSAAGGK